MAPTKHTVENNYSVSTKQDLRRATKRKMPQMQKIFLQIYSSLILSKPIKLKPKKKLWELSVNNMR